jgi:DNA-directed RNA polymerase specialized sigma24 family protein
MSDVILLEQLCSNDDDHHHYTHFVNRFSSELQEECKRICSMRKLDHHIGQQIANETFERVRKYKSFKKDAIKLPNDRKAILVYLKKISIRLFNDHHRKENKKDVTHRTYFEDILLASNSDIDIKALKNTKDIALIIFKKLNIKEQKVVLTDIEYKKHQKYLTDDVTAVLAQELNIKPATIRKIRERAIKKIKEAIDEINQN